MSALGSFTSVISSRAGLVLYWRLYTPVQLRLPVNVRR